MICCSTSCERSNKCGKNIYNLSTKYTKALHSVEYLDTFGSGSCSSDGCMSTYMCGVNGDYAMYEPIEKESEQDDDG